MIDVLKHQIEFIKSNARHTGLVGGFRSGKSEAGVLKTIAKKLLLPNVDVAYYLPTYPLIKDVAFKKFSDRLTELKIPFKLNETDKNIVTPYGRIIMRSMDKPEFIIGYEVGYSLVDEVDVMPLEKMNGAMKNILARNSAKVIGNNNATDFVSTPEGYKFLYNFFVKNASDNKVLIRASTKDNPYISDDYIKALEDEYSPEELSAYLNGEFVNLHSGNVYFFNRDTDTTDITITDKDVLHIGMDFNITNMSAVVHIIENGIKYAVSEFVEVYDTFSMIEKIKQRYPNQYVIVYPDASGQNRNTSGQSDVQLLQRAGFKVKVPSKNPFVRDRVNEANKQLRNGSYKVNQSTCPRYAAALEQIGYKGGEPDKTSGLDHVTDAGTYFIWGQKTVSFSMNAK
jgi:phage terminase large subunit